jgi:isopenicillin-N epimerase
VSAGKTDGQLDIDLVRAEWPPPEDGSLYFNTGSCGRKPVRVLRAIEDGWKQLNLNPTTMTFLDTAPQDAAREGIASLTGLNADDILLTQNSTQALHLVLASFLLKPGDELIATTHEHGSTNTVARYLQETRGIVVRKVYVEPLSGEQALFEGVYSFINEKTRLVLLSEIDCYSGWRPDLTKIATHLDSLSIPLIIDAAHSLGQGPVRAFPKAMYAGSCHKWLGAPNGTGFLFAPPKLAAKLHPVWISDRFYEPHEQPLGKFEFQGTGDVVRWLGVAAACSLQLELGQNAVAARQRELLLNLSDRIKAIPGSRIRTPMAEGETSGILSMTWEPERVKVEHLRDHLWAKYKIWTQPDFCYGQPGHGLRLSCHIAIEQSDIDRLINALRECISF